MFDQLAYLESSEEGIYLYFSSLERKGVVVDERRIPGTFDKFK
jgi:hypothetical protein